MYIRLKLLSILYFPFLADFPHKIIASPGLMMTLTLAGTMFVFWNMENFKKINLRQNKWKHALINSLFVLAAIPVQSIFTIAFVKVMQWDSYHHFGLLNLGGGINNPVLLAIISLVLLDLSEYIYHVIMHQVKLLWMLHLVHHSDLKVDVSTTLREHPGETFVRVGLSVFLGVPFEALLFRQWLQIISNVFAHSNIRLPEKINNIACLIFITPNLHSVHHHYKLPYTNCNYGDILSIWDRLFGTFIKLSADKVVFGIDTCMDVAENTNIKKLIILPFGKYRPTMVNKE
jgi:sterol desaturase/sphingolipid hydroxylase (fatty acid hydroxylase superfamily)